MKIFELGDGKIVDAAQFVLTIYSLKAFKNLT